MKLPIFLNIDVQNYQMYPGEDGAPGIRHEFTSGLHLIAGVNGLGKSTLLLMLYHGLVGPTSVRAEDYGVPQPELTPRRFADRFRRRVADGAEDASVKVSFKIGADTFQITRSLFDLSIVDWEINGATQAADEQTYQAEVVRSMNVGGFADVLVVLNLIVFMFEDRGLLMWAPLAQRNALRALFMSPVDANALAEKAQAVAKANSAYRNLLFIVNRDRKQLARDKAALATAGALSSEHSALMSAIAADTETLASLFEKRNLLDETRTDARTTHEAAKFNYDDLLRELEALKLARIANAFPKSSDAGRYMLARLIGDKECLACGAEDGPLIQKWLQAITDRSCVVCGAEEPAQEAVVPAAAVDTVRVARVEERLEKARDALSFANREAERTRGEFEELQGEIDKTVARKTSAEARVRQISGSLPPSPPAVHALEVRLQQQDEVLEGLRNQQVAAEVSFSEIFDGFKRSIEAKAQEIRERFESHISAFLVEKAEISLVFQLAPIGESGRSYEWPTFQLSMTSGTFDSPSPRRYRSEVSMSQGEFIDLAFRLALVETSIGSGGASLVFDAPEASLDALFMRRAGAFLSRFTQDHSENRLVVTSNLTNADMIPALFGAYEPLEGDPTPSPIPRSERRSRVIDLLRIAAPTSAVTLVKDRYATLLDRALFPPNGEGKPGL